MKVSFFVVAVSVLVLIFSGSTYARVASNGIPTCLVENAQVTITVNDAETDITVLKNKFDQKIADIEQAAKEGGAEKFVLQSSNYNVNSQNYEGNMDKQFRLNGSVTFHVEPAAKALGIMAILNKKGYMVSANVNAYTNNGAVCNNNANATAVE